ncbi:MAG: ribosomal protein [Hydrocarboniphaga sp.]|uniref:type I restriction enzyme HsdR N-terminal domain-containing protein n=1 Tax=Hydrocarboniphaga sp. TaxID=2033016 RepID=UPI002612F102|nr:type I restriction enzyme HsdR N-terminal domain-containing protein [Hydrocarboniphaga sp.]MDB5968899.1 ribosomal protein [Hydrocarboniphaga sp.]
MFAIDKSLYITESDVEQKFIYPLLTDLLDFTDGEILTKSYLSPSEIDKGAGKRLGYYPDYLLYLGGQPVLVVEAKEPGTIATIGYREARLYAAEINKGYPTGINPVSVVLSTNGRTLICGPSDSELDLLKFDLDELRPGTAALESLRNMLKRDVLLTGVQKVKRLLAPINRFRPIALLGGSTRQNEEIVGNTFSAQLYPLLRRYFDPDVTQYSDEVLHKGYVSSDEITKYEADLEALLKDRVPSQVNVSAIETTKTRAPAVDSALQKVWEDRKGVPDPLIILLGGVGAGKSMFIQRYFSFLMNDQLKQRLRTVTLNFNTASDSLDDVENWISAELVNELEKQEGETFLHYPNLLKFFGPDIAKVSAQSLSVVKKQNKKEYDLKIAELVGQWTDDPQKLCAGIVRFFVKDKSLPLIVVFDNVDRRSRDQQLKIFQSAQWFRHRNPCIVILTLRDETYDAYRNQPPLDAFLKQFTFRISPPRFVNVVKKRLELAIAHLSREAQSKQKYVLDNGMHIEYPTTLVGEYLFSIYLSLFHPDRQSRLVLEALSGKNIRNALEMFSSFLMSGYLSDSRIFNMTVGKDTYIPEWLVFRVLMRTKYKFYLPSHGYVFNIFAIPENSVTCNIFLIPELLKFLSGLRKTKGSLRLEGYVHVPEVVRHLNLLGYTTEDVMWAAETLQRDALIVADHQKNKGLSSDDYVKVTASGLFHLRVLPTNSEYLGNVIFDVPINDRKLAEEVCLSIQDSAAESRHRIQLLRLAIRKELYDCEQLISDFSQRVQTPRFFEQCISRTLAVHARDRDAPIRVPLDLEDD